MYTDTTKSTNDTQVRVPEAKSLLINRQGEPAILLTSQVWLSLQRFFRESESRPAWLKTLRERFKAQGGNEREYTTLFNDTGTVMDDLVECSYEWDVVYDRIVSIADGIVSHARKSKGLYAFMDKIITSIEQDAPNYSQKMKEVVNRLTKDATDRQNEVKSVETDLRELRKKLISEKLVDGKRSILVRMEELKRNTNVQGEINEGDDLTYAKLVKDVGGLQKGIEDLTKKIKQKNDEYEKSVTIAATTPTYSWIMFPPPLPIGLIAGVIVASIYGDKATDLSNEIDRIQRQLAASTAEKKDKTLLLTLISRVDSGLSELVRDIEIAGEQLALVSDAWGTIATDHENLAQAIGRMGLGDEFQREMAISDSATLWNLVKTKADFFRQAAFIQVEASKDNPNNEEAASDKEAA